VRALSLTSQALTLPWRGETAGVVGKALDGVRTVVNDVLRPSLAMALEHIKSHPDI
jgi:hypothetical protein